MLTLGPILLITFVLLLLQIRFGNKNETLTKITALLIACACGMIIMGVGFLKVFVQMNFSLLNIWTLSFGIAIYQIGFNVSHFYLALVYRDMPKKCSNKIEGKQGDPKT